MKRIIIAFLTFYSIQIQAQVAVQKNIEVGQYLKINPCKKGQEEFISMDVYARTQPYDKSKVDTLTGDGLLQVFFSDKSIDAKRLPCIMGGKKYKIAALHEFEREGQSVKVVLCYTVYPLTLIWIELDKAMENNEISFE